ncbi:mediator complex protein-domain-containing protein [Pseudoneurospora amorphoporcata]|uniref:Mediator of RNA polymerase II transcription subunit 11 n=1 Tax=Pseudoneurospora amorphoporcata TaxID=241081 RepID=A0AAN6NLT4_9PEZI|nr:mediator complex protein-domain-containing protein [Pseudoneurospora amorphoporcata]
MDHNAQPQGQPSQMDIDIHEPFTTAEHIQQLSNIDNDIVSLLELTSNALRCLASPPPTSSDQQTEAEQQKQQQDQEDATTRFTQIQSTFLSTLDRVDKQLRRQIYAMEEAGIINLRSSSSNPNANNPDDDSNTGGEPNASNKPGGYAAASAPKNPGELTRPAKIETHKGAKWVRPVAARLDPDGVGRYGNLDVGRMNMAIDTVERDMERELWARAREHAERVAREKGISASGPLGRVIKKEEGGGGAGRMDED